MQDTSVIERIKSFNKNRNPELLSLKYERMSQDAFSFFRGTCHLFYEDLPTETPLNEAPATWICGDLHFENFGSYKGDNKLVYFDLNDFDEAMLAPCIWDMARFITSIMVASHSLGIDRVGSLELSSDVLKTYRNTLSTGRISTIERDTATGMVKELLLSLKNRSRREFLDSRTQIVKQNRKLIIDPKRTLQVAPEERTRITSFMEKWALKQSEPNFFKLLDMAKRIAGNSSLGIERYVLLVEGEGSQHRNYLLDLKFEGVSSLQPYLKLAQPNWANQAVRVATIQKRVQGTPPALLQAVAIGEKSYLMRELQPTQDRVNLTLCNGKLRRLEKVANQMVQLVAWGQLRSGGRQGSASADEMIEFAASNKWVKPLLEYATAYALKVQSDYAIYKIAYNQGDFKFSN
ncbi:MAG: DUF2252 family protein [Chloroflexi bacterium]|nr:DUF2252 family protein [Chloroflexota bacterium]